MYLFSFVYVCVHIYLSISISFHQSLSIHLSIYLSIYPSVFTFFATSSYLCVSILFCSIIIYLTVHFHLIHFLHIYLSRHMDAHVLPLLMLEYKQSFFFFKEIPISLCPVVRGRPHTWSSLRLFTGGASFYRKFQCRQDETSKQTIKRRKKF